MTEVHCNKFGTTLQENIKIIASPTSDRRLRRTQSFSSAETLQ